MPGAIQHGTITQAVLGSLTPYFKLPTKEHEALIKQYCCYPDDFFSQDKGISESILPYTFIKDNIQFHYIPDTPLNELYRYWLPAPKDHRLEKPKPFYNSNFFHAKEGFEFYLNNIVKCFKKDNYKEGAKFAGCLMHMLEDSSFGAHSLEGPLGTDLFVLERLFEEQDDFKMKPLYILTSLDCSKLKSFAYCPKLLGKSVPEIVMRLYAEYVKTVAMSRRACFKIVQNVYSRKEDQNQALIQAMFSNTVKICTDMLFSAFSVANQKLKDTEHLKKVSLTELEPFQFPLGGSGGYRFLSYLKNIAVNSNMKKIPLQLKLDNETISFDKGLSFGSHYEVSLCYWVPEGVYSTFETCIGLHPDSLNQKSGVRIQLINNGAKIQEFDFNENFPATRITIPNPRGKLGFKISYTPGCSHQANIITIGNPNLSA
jgi:hypothetical protein